MENITKPKLVFFQPKHDQNLPNFTLLHRQQHIKCLSEFFEVILIHEDCDYQQICDKYQPDLTLFENAGNILDCHRLTIKNTHTHPQVPKLGLLNADAWCNSRAVFLSDMERWGIGTFFSISITAAEHTPEIAENLFVWPNFIDAEIYRDYGESKIVPVLFTGANYALYPWRQKIFKCVSQYYPSLVCPHLGYGGKQATARMIYGERYARTINASWFVPACGTVAKEMVRKHLEIPASRACLITEQSSALEAAGFVDMQNCVFADEHNVLDKLDYLFQNQEELESIINAGYQLAHSRHTLKQRDQIFQWFNLHKNLKPHQKVIQTSPFEPLIVVEKASRAINSHIKCDGLNSMLIHQGDKELEAHQYDKAEALYFRCLYHVGIMHEPKLRLAICSLYKGNAEKALEWIIPSIKCILEVYKAFDPDPVEWAYFIVALLCLGKLEEAKKRCDEFPNLSHTELDRVRWIVNLLTKTNKQHVASSDWRVYRASVHHLPDRNLSEWTKNICLMLRACSQLSLASNLEVISLDNQLLKLSDRNSNSSAREVLKSSEIQIISSEVMPKNAKLRNNRVFIRSELRKKFLKKIQQTSHKLISPLNLLEAKYGYFLPFPISEIRNDELLSTIKRLIKEENAKNLLLIGVSLDKGMAELLLNTCQEIAQGITVFCINQSSPQFTKLQRRYKNHSTAKFYQLPINCTNSFTIDIENCIGQIKLENEIDCFDMVLMGTSDVVSNIELSDRNFYMSKFFILEGINTLQGYKEYQYLSSTSTYILESQNPCLRNGYAIFKRIDRCSYFLTKNL
ncbi:glycosyltransferase [Scytonema millei]|uniref:Glycosyltransferase family 1 protein n=1 Tax=Scytonema millei VB511283 TaxID=1245923 RepID=A0A9X5E450_9CYAN|nr:glycosyltransferase [Scytonema millei]NHC33844.1 glycosyltransferase family 1 protein [Scytonema millei VB511283]